MRIIPVILSGGVGSRLWPPSRSTAPKQIQRLLGDHSMLQSTVLRIAGIEGVEPPLVVCNESHVEIVDTQLEAIGHPPARIVAEPTGRNTAAAIAAAALISPQDDILLVLPADHVVTDVRAFEAAVKEAVSAAEQQWVVTFGIKPHRIETGYGYIRIGALEGAWRRIEGFTEKPDPSTAAAYVSSGSYLWNSGMFCLRADVAIEQLKLHAADVVEAVAQAVGSRMPDERVIRLTASFLRSPSISFDHAVMEKTDRGIVIPLDVGWSDVGSWATLWEIEERDADDNVVRGDAEVLDVHRSYVRSDGRLVAVVGLDDVVVVDTGDAVLVAARDRAQEVKALVERLATSNRPEIE